MSQVSSVKSCIEMRKYVHNADTTNTLQKVYVIRINFVMNFTLWKYILKIEEVTLIWL